MDQSNLFLVFVFLQSDLEQAKLELEEHEYEQYLQKAKTTLDLYRFILTGFTFPRRHRICPHLEQTWFFRETKQKC